MLLWIVDLALVSCGVILPLVLEIYYVYVYCVPLFDSRLSLSVCLPPRLGVFVIFSEFSGFPTVGRAFSQRRNVL